MKREIDNDYYCPIMASGGICEHKEKKECEDCVVKTHKHPTPEQFKKEYGKNVPKDMAVYCYTFDGAGYSWVTCDYKWAKEYKQDFEPIVCACTPFPKPKNDWRPE